MLVATALLLAIDHAGRTLLLHPPSRGADSQSLQLMPNHMRERDPPLVCVGNEPLVRTGDVGDWEEDGTVFWRALLCCVVGRVGGLIVLSAA